MRKLSKNKCFRSSDINTNNVVNIEPEENHPKQTLIISHEENSEDAKSAQADPTQGVGEMILSFIRAINPATAIKYKKCGLINARNIGIID